jgi:hypothetical protein
MARTPSANSRGTCDDNCAREFAGHKQADRAVKRRTLGVSEDRAVNVVSGATKTRNALCGLTLELSGRC